MRSPCVPGWSRFTVRFYLRWEYGMTAFRLWAPHINLGVTMPSLKIRAFLMFKKLTDRKDICFFAWGETVLFLLLWERNGTEPPVPCGMFSQPLPLYPSVILVADSEVECSPAFQWTRTLISDSAPHSIFWDETSSSLFHQRTHFYLLACF